MDSKTLAHQFGICSYVADLNAKDLTHQESLISPKPGGNCANWVLGHALRARLLVLQVLQQPAPFAIEELGLRRQWRKDVHPRHGDLG